VAKSPSRILVVDDDPILLALAESQLRTAGFDVIMAANGRAALTRLARERVDLVTIDLEMPGMHGLDLLRKLRSEPRTAHLPVVIITSHQDIASIDEAYEAGASSFLVKPVNWALANRHLRFVLRASLAERMAQELSGQLQSAFCGNQEPGAIYSDQRISVSRMIEDEATALAQLVDERMIDLRINCAVADISLIADDTVFRKAMRHYLHSAIKVTPRRGAVEVGLTQSHSGGLAITIRDQGPGMKPEVARSLSSIVPGEDGVPRARKRSGADLAVARELLEAIDGRIVFDAGSAGGSMASIVFPSSRVVRNEAQEAA
jgi:CheY-like chemotaxis protein